MYKKMDKKMNIKRKKDQPFLIWNSFTTHLICNILVIHKKVQPLSIPFTPIWFIISLLLLNSINKDIDECAEITGICAFRCKNLAGSYMCDCPRGYQVAADGRMCEDIDECADGSLCQQRCKNLFGSHMCLCYDGYASIGDRCIGKCQNIFSCTLWNNRYDSS